MPASSTKAAASTTATPTTKPLASRKSAARTGILATALTTGAVTAALLLSPSAGLAAQASSGSAANPSSSSSAGGSSATVSVDSLTTEQVDNARTIIGTGKADDISDHGITIALMTAMQESSLLDQEGGDRDSAGLFQQRPSMGWGSYEDVVDPVAATQSFFGTNDAVDNPGLLQIDGWEQMERGAAAQAVQRSAFPDAYDRWETLAQDLLENHGDVDPIS